MGGGEQEVPLFRHRHELEPFGLMANRRPPLEPFDFAFILDLCSFCTLDPSPLDTPPGL